jgi:hypothetical protein
MCRVHLDWSARCQVSSRIAGVQLTARADLSLAHHRGRSGAASLILEETWSESQLKRFDDLDVSFEGSCQFKVDRFWEIESAEGMLKSGDDSIRISVIGIMECRKC